MVQTQTVTVDQRQAFYCGGVSNDFATFLFSPVFLLTLMFAGGDQEFRYLRASLAMRSVSQFKLSDASIAFRNFIIRRLIVTANHGYCI